MECDRTRELIPLAVGGELLPSVSERVHRHVATCSDCQATLDSQNAAFEALRTVFACDEDEISRCSAGSAIPGAVLDKLEMNCPLVLRLAPLTAGGELPVPTTTRLKWHTDRCDKCRHEAERYAALRQTCLAAVTAQTGAFDDATEFWSGLEPQLEREALFATLEEPAAAPTPRVPSRAAAVRFYVAAAALLLFGIFAGLQLGNESFFEFFSGEQEAGVQGGKPAVPHDTVATADGGMGILPMNSHGRDARATPNGRSSSEQRPTPDPTGPSDTLVAKKGATDSPRRSGERLPRLTPVGATNVPFALGSLQTQKTGRNNAIGIVLEPTETSGVYKIQQIKIVPQEHGRPRKF